MKGIVRIAGVVLGLCPVLLFGKDQVGFRGGGFWAQDVEVDYTTDKISDFDESLDGFLLGIEGNIYLMDQLALEITGDLSQEDTSLGDLELWMGGVGLKLDLVPGKVRPYVGGSVGLLYYDYASDMGQGRGTEYYLRGKAGDSVALSERIELFAEGSYRYVPEEVTFQKAGRRYWYWPEVSSDLSAFEAVGGIRIGL